MIARSTVNTEGTRLRSSSVKTRPGSAIVRRKAAFRRLGERDILFGQKGARDPGSSTSPRAFSASIRIARPRAEITSGGSMVAVSQRV